MTLFKGRSSLAGFKISQKLKELTFHVNVAKKFNSNCATEMFCSMFTGSHSNYRT